eukprot:COSAG03_NODE_3638_length_1905_cov_2.049834_3_plen_48_part_00
MCIILYLCNIEEEVMAFGSFDATARVWWPEDRPSAELTEEPIAGLPV